MRRASLTILIAVLVVSSAGCFRGSSYYIERGNKLFASGKYWDASLNYRKALQKDTSSAEAHFRLGLSEFRLQNLDASWDHLNRAYELAPQRDDIKIELGKLSLAGLLVNPSGVNFYNRLKQISDQLLAKDANSFQGLRLKAYVAFNDRLYDQAIPPFRRAHELMPNQSDVAISLVRALFQNNQESEGERIARSYITSNPHDPAGYDVLYVHYARERRDPAVEEILKLKIANNPGVPRYVSPLADFFWHRGRQGDASDWIAKMLAGSGDPAQKRLVAGDFYGSVERWQEARQQFEQGMRESPAQTLLFEKRIANVFLGQGNNTEAARLVDEILKREPRDQEALKVRAGLKLNGRDPQALQSAVSDYKDLLKTNGQDASLHYALGQAFRGSGDPSAAKAEFQEAVRLRREYLEPRTALAELALQQNRPDEALKWCNEAISIEPDNTGPRVLKAMALRASHKSEQARQELNTVLRTSPQNAAALLQLGILETESKNYKAAEQTFTKLARLNVKEAAGGMATLYTSEGQLDKALDVVGKAVQQSPDLMMLHEMHAALAVRAQKYDVAIQELQTVISKDPNSTSLCLRLAEAQRLKGDWKASIATLERAQRQAPKDPLPALVLGSTLESIGNSAGAIAQFRRAFELKPDDPAVANNLAFLIADTNGNLDEAMRLAQLAVRKAPTESNFADTLGWVYLKKTSADSALQIFDRLVNQHPDSPTFRYHLGAALLQKGDRAKARAALEAALAHGPSKQETEKIRELLAKAG
jgi:tetratricopeptide (TPR) repeat protein